MSVESELPPTRANVAPMGQVPSAMNDVVMDEHMERLIGHLVHARSHIGGYDVVRKLGAGGMGEVFAVRHAQTGRQLALKTLSSTTATRLYRFKREFRALADVDHRNLVRLHDLVVPETGPAFFTMELIDGQPFVAWVRGGAPVGKPPALGRLEQALRQLVEGVHHLHAHGCIHRDLKPSNVLVTHEGRVVVLDFGLVSEPSEPERGITRDRQILGTPSYMAPEQARAEAVEAAADWYAVGVMLFECLTGRLPHEGPALKQLVAKQEVTPDPGDRTADAPEELRSLCVQLMSRDPQARPRGRELLERLHARAPSTADRGPPFVGRQGELAALHAALDDVARQGELVVVHLRGRSGDGKSALVQRFRRALRSREVVVLHGRCREREAMPYKGVDAIIDALSAHLRRLPAAELAALRPSDLGPLVRVFPVLDEIWPPGESQPVGLDEVRKLGGMALRTLLERVAKDRPILLHIDDFQWADLDSVSLLQELARASAASAMLLLLAYRSEHHGSEALRALQGSELLSGPRARLIDVGPLSSADARELAGAILSVRAHVASQARNARAETIALHSGGSPFFIAQMAMGEQTLDVAESDLDQILVRRLSSLDEPARRLMELAAVFGGPMSLRLVLELGHPATTTTIDSLCALGLLVREQELHGGPDAPIAVAHDRVREVVLAGLEAAERQRLHRRIGEHLLASQAGAVVGDGIFALVNHLGAGRGELEALSPEHRLALAKLERQAGERALGSAAWVAAGRHLSHARELVEPWLEEVRRGRGELELCVAIELAWAQAAIALGDAEGDAAIEELMRWSLPLADHCRIARWYCQSLALRGRFEQCLEFGIEALARLGFRVPRRPSWVRTLLAYVQCWRLLSRFDLRRQYALPPTGDERIGASMVIMGTTAAMAIVEPKLQLVLSAIYGRLLARHGMHEGATLALSSLVVPSAAFYRIPVAKAVCELADELVESNRASSWEIEPSKGFLLLALPTFRPSREVLANSEQAYRRACDVAPRVQIEMIWIMSALTHFFAGARLPQVRCLVDSMSDGDFMMAVTRDYRSVMQQWVAALVEGGTPLPRDLGPHMGVNQRATVLVLQLLIAILLGDREHALETMQWLERVYEHPVAPFWGHPCHAVSSTVVLVDQWRRQGGRGRRRLRKRLRARRALGRRWAERCPENYQPMLDVIEGELAGLEDRYEDAFTHFERAGTAAAGNEMRWLAGLAYERLARLARHRGHALLTEAAFDAAQRAYEAWGAFAVVRRIEHERARSDHAGS